MRAILILCGLILTFSCPARAERRIRINSRTFSIPAAGVASLNVQPVRKDAARLGGYKLDIVGKEAMNMVVSSQRGLSGDLLSRSSSSATWFLNYDGSARARILNSGSSKATVRVSALAAKSRKGKTPTPTITPTSIPGLTPTAEATPATPRLTPTASATIGLGIGASLGGRRPFPSDNAWNQDVSAEPVDPNSAALISSIGLTTGLHPDFGTFLDEAKQQPIGIPYVVVPGTQPKVPIDFSNGYADESDPGPYPVPANAPVEGGSASEGDRHVLVIDRDEWKLYELFASFPLPGGAWQALSGAVFDLNSNALRPAGWTSADAAGLPIFPGLVRYDEVMEQGVIDHALRFTVQRSRRAYVHPARHFASSNTSTSLPPMGMRVRLKAGVNISTYPTPVQVILRGLKKYGMIVADNGSNWFISGAHDPRWDDEMLSSIRGIKGSDFEVVKMGTLVTN